MKNLLDQCKKLSQEDFPYHLYRGYHPFNCTIIAMLGLQHAEQVVRVHDRVNNRVEYSHNYKLASFKRECCIFTDLVQVIREASRDR